MTFRIVPRGTPGALTLRAAMDIRLRELGLRVPTEELRQKMRASSRAAWNRGAFDGIAEKNSIALRKHHGRACRGKRV